jgi:(1->4)-alpha-D-glucan 1-alpha-D-glucosylmutase
LARLCVGDVYLSPLFRSREHSSHGYDVVDHNAIEPSFGDEAALGALVQELRQHGMGLLLDVVPNHMGINDPGNAWWIDVLENGEASRHAYYFDIDWDSPARNLKHRVLLPFLGERFGIELEAGRLRLLYDDRRLQLSYHDRRFPLAPPSWPLVLEVVLEELEEAESGEAKSREPNPLARCAIRDSAAWLSTLDSRLSTLTELESIATQLRNLPPGERRDEAALRERYREQRVARARLAKLLEDSPPVRAALDAALERINGEVGKPESFDLLETILDAQWYRLSYWRVASDEINYRRFFDINDLAAIRVEDDRVFEATHQLVARLLDKGWATGLRVDHPDGLYDPRQYFENLQSLFRRANQTNKDEEQPALYVVAEKILSGDEQLPSDWPVSGTTGYDFLNLLNRLLVDEAGLAALREAYPRLTGVGQTAAEVLYESKKSIVQDVMSSEVNVLAARLYRIAQRHRSSRDFTLPAILRALREVIACVETYRTYLSPRSWEAGEDDYRRVTSAARWAKRRNPTMPRSLFDFIASVLLLETPPLSKEQAEPRREFALKLQQVTGPVTAKGLEDTAFYRYYPLASLNEVGGELDTEPLSVAEFHRRMRHRASDWPHALSATATHDTKRGEDVRARLHVLTEAPEEWIEAVERWQETNRPRLREIDGQPAPSRNEQYLLYQTLVGTWPLEPLDEAGREQYAERIERYMEKALREAKVHTSWLNPAPEYEEAALGFVREVLRPDAREFQDDLDRFARKIAGAGFVNGLAQTVLKATLPGVPDVYQGNELWDFHLVDPDNRRPVDFERRERLLAELERDFDRDALGCARELRAAWPDPRVKLFALWRALRLRGRWPEVFAEGEYLPLETTGVHAEHVLAFARRHGDRWAAAVVPLHFQSLRRKAAAANGRPGLPEVDWADTQVRLPDDAPRAWRHAFTNETLDLSAAAFDVAALFQALPAALLFNGLK